MIVVIFASGRNEGSSTYYYFSSFSYCDGFWVGLGWLGKGMDEQMGQVKGELYNNKNKGEEKKD